MDTSRHWLLRQVLGRALVTEKHEAGTSRGASAPSDPELNDGHRRPLRPDEPLHLCVSGPAHGHRGWHPHLETRAPSTAPGTGGTASPSGFPPQALPGPWPPCGSQVVIIPVGCSPFAKKLNGNKFVDDIS